ncbi:hypothetical protein [Streptomyces sp. E5N91]|uniref:hypothetical protein n=1 Tax=Streptomyces sp. E5N91 TaxID=1851996 RepID=UPI001EE87E0B|nr:hypothetical protein [Streptomyces sp. E5N91]
MVPALDELITRVPAHWDGGRGLLSVVDVHDLARLVVTVATAEQPLPGVQHASHPEPVSNADLMAALTALDVLPEVTESWSWEKCVRQLHATPGRMSERQFSLLARDHWYRSEEIWRVTECPAGPGPVHRLPAAAEWYTSHLGAQRSRTPR